MAFAPRATRHRFTVDDYYRMGEAGVLGEDDRVELIDGEIIDLSPVGSRHAACVKRLNHLLASRLGAGVITGAQDPVRLSDLSEPQPDVSVLRRRDDFYAAGHPAADDVLLLIEVADTSLAFDRDVKAPLYARAGVCEVWVVDLDGETVDVFHDPAQTGYAAHHRAGRGETLEAAGMTVTVDEILG